MVRPGVKYTREEVAALRNTPEFAKMAFRGYVWTVTLDGMFELVHWSKAAGGGYRGGAPKYKAVSIDTTEQGSSYGRRVVGTFDKSQLPPIVKRTPQQRVDSLMARVGEDLKQYLASKTADEVAGEDVREVAASSLDRADKQFEEAERKRVVRTTGAPYA